MNLWYASFFDRNLDKKTQIFYVIYGISTFNTNIEIFAANSSYYSPDYVDVSICFY